MAQEPGYHMQESDIGSGEKTPAQKDRDHEIASLRPPAGTPQDRQGQNDTSDDTMTTATQSRERSNGTHPRQGVQDQQRIRDKHDPADVRDRSPPPSRILRGVPCNSLR